MALPAALAWYRNPVTTHILPDLGHDVIPAVNGAHHFADVVMKAHIALTLTWILWQQPPVARRILIRFFTVAGYLNVLRSGMLLLTSIPDPYPACRQIAAGPVTWVDMPWMDVIRRALRLAAGQSDLTCGDMLFSGHTTLLVLCGLVWCTYCNQRGAAFVKVFTASLSLFGILLIIATKMHYTIDCALSVYFSMVTWYMYPVPI
jgi:hypothetical protein